MELLDRYLESVRKYLPWQRQDDIIAELRANLESQLEDKEAELGRPLTKEEAEAWLKEIGPPTKMAARYQPQQYLIGPTFFPVYWMVMRLTFFWVAAIYVVVNAVVIATTNGTWNSVLQACLRLPLVLMTTAAWITLTFAAIEFIVTHYPSKLPTISVSDGWPSTAMPALEDALSPKKKQRTRAHAIAEVIFGFLFLIWLLLVPQHPYVLWGPGAAFLHSSPFRLAPIWFQFYCCIVVLNVLQLGWRCVELARGAWRQAHPVQQVVMKAIGLIPLGVLLSGQVWVLLRNPALDQAQYGPTADGINQGIRLSLTVVCAIVSAQLIWEAGRLGLNAYRRRIAAMR